MENHAYILEKKIVKCMVICQGFIILLLLSLLFFINLNILDVFSPAGNQHQVNIYLLLLLLLLHSKNKKVILYYAGSLYH